MPLAPQTGDHEEEQSEMTQATYQQEEKSRLSRELTEKAMKLALESNWEEAVEANQRLLSLNPRDLSTLNRLGKALSELGRYGESKQAYAHAIEIDPTTNIARKTPELLTQLSDEAPAGRPSHERMDPRLFIEETGKPVFTNLVDLALREVLARLTAGDQVYLYREGSLLYARNGAGDRIGRIEPRLASRLIKFIDGGNQYAAGIPELNDHLVRLIIRETFQSPNMFGRVSFPAQAGGETVRGYIKDTMVRYEQDEEAEFGEDGHYLDTDQADAGAAKKTPQPQFQHVALPTP